MRELFERLKSQGEAGLHDLVADRALEGVQLDFKLKSQPNSGAFEREDKKVFGRVLSAFSNSSGGLIVWGVDARPGPDNVDCAQELVPIAEIDRFHSEAVRLTGQLLMPRHDGIETFAIHSRSAPGKGYLPVYVERSDRRPHRSEASGDGRYYKRAGDSSFAMEHYDIEDAFNRFISPVLDCGWHMTLGRQSDGPNGVERFYRLTLQLINGSRTTARFPYLNIRHIKGAHINPVGLGSGGHAFPQRQEGAWTCFASGADTVIHPGQVLSAVVLVVQHSVDKGTIQGVPIGRSSVSLEYQLGCADSQMRIGELIISNEELLPALARLA